MAKTLEELVLRTTKAEASPIKHTTLGGEEFESGIAYADKQWIEALKEKGLLISKPYNKTA